MVLWILTNVMNFSIYHIFKFRQTQKCQHWQICVLRENSNVLYMMTESWTTVCNLFSTTMSITDNTACFLLIQNKKRASTNSNCLSSFVLDFFFSIWKYKKRYIQHHKVLSHQTLLDIYVIWLNTFYGKVYHMNSTFRVKLRAKSVLYSGLVSHSGFIL